MARAKKLEISIEQEKKKNSNMEKTVHGIRHKSTGSGSVLSVMHKCIDTYLSACFSPAVTLIFQSVLVNFHRTPFSKALDFTVNEWISDSQETLTILLSTLAPKCPHLDILKPSLQISTLLITLTFQNSLVYVIIKTW